MIQKISSYTYRDHGHTGDQNRSNSLICNILQAVHRTRESTISLEEKSSR